jgi:G3E family GTPase
MIPLYLVTGFLGAGKTTFLKEFIPRFAGKKIAVIVNEFGREGVDQKLLRGLGTVLSEVAGGSAFCTCKLHEFEAVLEKTITGKPEIIIIEASGFSDPQGMCRLMESRPVYRDLVYSGCICLADVPRFAKVYSTAATVKKQLDAATVVVLNKIDLADERNLEETLEIITSRRPGIPVIKTSFGKLPPDVSLFLDPSPGGASGQGILSADISLHSLVLEFDETFSRTEAEKILRELGETTYRIKGFLRLAEGTFLADCVGEAALLSPAEEKDPGNRVNLLYGHGLPARRTVEAVLSRYPGKLRLIEEASR